MNGLEAHLLWVLGWRVGLKPAAYRRWEMALLMHVRGGWYGRGRTRGSSRGVIGATLPLAGGGGGGGGGGGVGAGGAVGGGGGGGGGWGVALAPCRRRRRPAMGLVTTSGARRTARAFSSCRRCRRCPCRTASTR
eukprot:TRINITY_DN3136_c0_g1_i3.p4 TRINITY_DN3136_c0_g1~~TRINITY_DN3136_c0_g1_i3.p4  ORF type:complete len:135 (+),score=21.98 TRINITY_DN3136_c0_g1_i3:533-937(+)